MSCMVWLTFLRWRVAGWLGGWCRSVVLLGWGRSIVWLGYRWFRGADRRVGGGTLTSRGQGGRRTLLERRLNRETDVNVVGSTEVDRTKTAGAESDRGRGGLLGFIVCVAPCKWLLGIYVKRYSIRRPKNRNCIPRCNPQTHAPTRDGRNKTMSQLEPVGVRSYGSHDIATSSRTHSRPTSFGKNCTATVFVMAPKHGT